MIVVLVSVRGTTVIEGGLPILVDGKIVGSIGVSGVASQQGLRSRAPAQTR